MDEHNMNILDRIHASYYQLAAAERRVADYVLSQYHQVQFMSITQLAEECGTADATVSRFCRSLKLKGFNAFKLELAKYSASASTAADGLRLRPIPTDTASGRCAEAGRLSQEAISQTISLIRMEDIKKTVSLFEEADRVFCMGAGGSMLLANECAHLFSTVCNKFTDVWDSHMQMSITATMNENDVIVLFSYSGATQNGVEVLELAKQRGIRTVLITRYPKSPAASLATVVLCCGSSESPFQFGSVPAKVAQLVLLDVLFQEYFHRNRAECEESLQRIASALSEKHI
ncbi:MAG: MurR/RpiR family transcriptional regulator [Oscillospiraceae bacterium]|nr:MurR/RpiR family transcriptional regulator [Oscillospiraceae bacterium]